MGKNIQSTLKYSRLNGIGVFFDEMCGNAGQEYIYKYLLTY
jgi:hypothetical protein